MSRSGGLVAAGEEAGKVRLNIALVITIITVLLPGAAVPVAGQPGAGRGAGAGGAQRPRDQGPVPRHGLRHAGDGGRAGDQPHAVGRVDCGEHCSGVTTQTETVKMCVNEVEVKL